MIVIDKDSPNIVLTLTSCVKSGGVVVAPTDTVYGMLTDARNKLAVAKIFTIKSRPLGKAISVFVRNWEEAAKYVITDGVPAHVRALAPGPYTFVLPGRANLANDLYGEDGSLGVRIVEDELISAVLDQVGSPITATSANKSGASNTVTHTAFINSLSDADSQLVDIVVATPPSRREALPSTVLDIRHHMPQVLRGGAGIFEVGQGTNAISHTINSLSELETLASRLFGDYLKNAKNAIVLLNGDMGVGKTTFAKMLLQNLGIHDATSPTYNLESEYDLETGIFKKIYHCDYFNLASVDDLDVLDFERYAKSETMTIIEWPNIGSQRVESMRDRVELMLRLDMRYLSLTSREVTISRL